MYIWMTQFSSACEHMAQDKDAYRHYRAFSSPSTRLATRSILHVALTTVT